MSTIDLNTLPHHPRSYARRDGYVYVISASTGIVKAGKTRNPRGRIGDHIRYATKFGATIDRLWLSPMHENYSQNEVELLAALGTPEHGNEYFRTDFESAVAAAERLQFVILTEDERLARDERLDADIRARSAWLAGPKLPEGFVNVKVPEALGNLLATMYATNLPESPQQGPEPIDPTLLSEMSLRTGFSVGELASWSMLDFLAHLTKMEIEIRRLELIGQSYEAGRDDLREPIYAVGPDRPAGAINPQDALKHAAARLHARTDWIADAIAGSGCSGGHDDELNAICDIAAEVNGLAADFGDRFVYSDGRAVKTCKEIADGLSTEHIWHPDPAQEQPASWRGSLPSGDPDVPSPGMYEVSTDPATQEIHVRVVRAA